MISNAYPMDVSLTFMRSKGILPLLRASPGPSRIVVSACAEGAGYHGLFPFVNLPRFDRGRQIVRRVRVKPSLLPELVITAVARRATMRTRAVPEPSQQRIHLYVPGSGPSTLPGEIPGMRRAGT